MAEFSQQPVVNAANTSAPVASGSSATSAAAAAATSSLVGQIEITSENVERIVAEFYTTSQLTNEFKPQLDQWLKHAQNSKEAWSFAWQLVDMSKSTHCQFFGASCLYNKVSKHLTEVPVDELDMLKNKLLEKLLLYAASLAHSANSQTLLIQRKLDSTLAKLALYLIEDQWPTCIYDIIQTIPNCVSTPPPPPPLSSAAAASLDNQQQQQQQRIQLVLIVVDVCTLLPEEFATLGHCSALSKQKRAAINAHLKKNFFLIGKYLLSLLQQFNEHLSTSTTVAVAVAAALTVDSLVVKLVESCVKCLTSWIDFGIPFGDVEPFIDFLFAYVYNEQLFDQSAECLTFLFSAEDNLKFVNSIFRYMVKVLQLHTLLAKYVEEKDNDGCVVLTKLILAFGENQLSSIFNGLLYGDEATKKILFDFMQLIMSLSSMPGSFPVDEESSDLTFVFWYNLQDTLLGMGQKTGDLQVIFRPFFVQLLNVFIEKLKLSVDYDAWADEEKERVRCYRIDIGDTMVYMISMVGEVMLEFIVRKLMDACADANDWRTQEALIYMLQSVVSELNESCHPDVSSQNDPFLVSFVDMLPKINYSNKHILSTTLLAVGSLGNWLQRNPQVLPNAISLCLLGLRTESVTQSASFALKDIANDCELVNYADQIIATCQECLRTGQLASNYEVRLMSIVGLCLQDLFPSDMQRTVDWLNAVVDPYIQRVRELAELTPPHIDKHTQALTCHLLNMFTQLISSLIPREKSFGGGCDESSSTTQTSINVSLHSSYIEQQQQQATTSGAATGALSANKTIVNSILIKLLPIYKTILKRNLPVDQPIIDKMFESVSVSLASSMSSSNPQLVSEDLEAMIGHLIDMFNLLNENAWRRYAFEVCRQMLVIWGKHEKYKVVLENLFVYSHQNAMKLISRDMNWFHEHTDVVEQYCTYLAKLLKSKNYELFDKLNMDALVALMRFVQLALQLPEQYTLRAVSMFLEEFVKMSKPRPALSQFVQQHSFNIIQIIIIGISGGLPRHLVEILASALYAFNREYPQLMNAILQQILINMNFQPHLTSAALASGAKLSDGNAQQQQLLSKEQKTIFIRSVSNEANNKRKFKEIVNEFSLACRGLINTQYGRETSAIGKH